MDEPARQVSACWPAGRPERPATSQTEPPGGRLAQEIPDYYATGTPRLVFRPQPARGRMPGMSELAVRKRWKRYLYYPALLVGVLTAYLFGQQEYVAATISGALGAALFWASFTVNRCPACGHKFYTIGALVAHCVKCGTAYSAANPAAPTPEDE